MVVSAVGFYRSPVTILDMPGGQQGEPLLVLYKKLEELCISARDPYEIAVHLETIGYNRYRVQREFGMSSVFELAEKLYALVPREFPPIPSSPVPRCVAGHLLWKYLAILPSLLAVAVFHFRGGYTGWVIAIWLLAWSNGGYFLVNRAGGELDPSDIPGVRAWLILLGVLAIFILSLFSTCPLAALAAGIFWTGAVGMLWEGRPWISCIIGATAVVGTWLGVGVQSFLIAGVPCILKLIMHLRRDALQWLMESLPEGAYPGLYGFGQGLLLYAFSRHAPIEVFCKVTVLTLAWAFSFDIILHRFAVTVNKALWECPDFHGFFCRIRCIIIACAAILFLPLGIVGCVFIFIPDFLRSYFLAFGLWTLMTGTGIWLFSLGERRWPTGIIFFAGVIVAAAGDHWIPVSIIAALVLIVCLIRVLRQPVRYGIWFL